MGEEGSEPVSLFMVLPSAVRHYPQFTFIPPEVEIVSKVSAFGIDVTRLLPSGMVKAPEEREESGTRTFYFPIRTKVRAGSKLFDQIHKCAFVAHEFRKGRRDIVFLRNDIAPAIMFDSLLSAYLRRRYRCRLIFQMENPLDQNLASRLMQKKRSELSARLVSALEGFIVRINLSRADLVLPINKQLKKDLLDIGVDEGKIIIVPEGIKRERFQNADGDVIRKRLGLEGHKVIVYSGMIDKARNLEMLIRAFADLRSRMPAKLMMVGDGNDCKRIEKLVVELGVADDVIFTWWIPQDEVPGYISAADIGVCLVPPLDFYKKSSPLKMLEYMAAGRAVVANLEIPEQKDVAEASGAGVLVTYDIKGISEGLESLLKDERSLRDHAARGKEWVMANRTYDTLAGKLAVDLRKLKKKCR